MGTREKEKKRRMDFSRPGGDFVASGNNTKYGVWKLILRDFCSRQRLKTHNSTTSPTLQISDKYFEASNSKIPSASLQRIWAALVKKAKLAQSDAQVSSVRTGGGDGDAPLLDDATAQILAVAQAAVQLATPGKLFLHYFHSTFVVYGWVV
jgi:hypothetical protein